MNQGLHTLGRWLPERARATPDRVAIDYRDRLVTYAELERQAQGLAAALGDAGLRHGDRVATLTGNRPEHVALLHACARLGLILLPLNRRLAPAELRFQLEDAEPSLLLVEEELAELAVRAPGRSLRPAPFESFAAAAALMLDDAGADAQLVEDDDGLLLIYTSGTTGRPKGALLTHGNCFWTNLAFDLTAGVTGEDVVLQVLPQFHVGGWNVQALLAWWKGATVVLERSFDAGRCLALVERKRVTTMMGVPANYLFMAREPGFATADLSSLRRAVVGGAPMPEALLKTWAGRGVAIVQGYGLTEAAPNVLCVPPEDAVRKAGCAGRPYPFVETALRDPSSGLLLDGPAHGELVVRGPNVFPGYWGNGPETAAAFADGWLLTGDVAERDEEGFYRIRGRLKDMYISGGENVYPAEVEAVLHTHADVADVAVVAVPDERWGEAGIAVVVARDGAAVTEEELLDLCGAQLAHFKVPCGVRFVSSLPRSGVGKLDKATLLAGLGLERTVAG